MHFPQNLVREFEKTAAKQSSELALDDATASTKGDQAMSRLGPAMHPCWKSYLRRLKFNLGLRRLLLYRHCRSSILGLWQGNRTFGHR